MSLKYFPQKQKKRKRHIHRLYLASKHFEDFIFQLFITDSSTDRPLPASPHDSLSEINHSRNVLSDFIVCPADEVHCTGSPEQCLAHFGKLLFQIKLNFYSEGIEMKHTQRERESTAASVQTLT